MVYNIKRIDGNLVIIGAENKEELERYYKYLTNRWKDEKEPKKENDENDGKVK